MNLSFLQSYPFLRLTLPLAAGIACGYYLTDTGSISLPVSAVYALPIAGLALLLLLIAAYRHRSAHSQRWMFGSLLSAGCFLMGGLLSIGWHSRVAIELSGHEETYVVRLTDRPEEKRNTLLFSATLLSAKDSAGAERRYTDTQVMLYIRKDSAARTLQANDLLLLSTELRMPEGCNEVNDFSYSSYLMRRGISAVCYADSAEWALKRMHDDRLTMAQAATSCRDKAISFFRSLGIGGDNLALLSALTLGYRNTLDRELREAYSTAGVSHVLAVSGMHIGFICAVLMFLLRIVPLRGRAAKAIKYLIATAALWAYVFFIGMPVSAVRAACMFTLLLLADAIGRERNSMNNLLFSAYVMLLVRPMWLLDVGFQLSFMAVAAMLIVVPWLHRRYSPRNPIARYAWGILSATIAAQIGTAPLTLLYFHRFPTLFFITNPLIVLLASLIIYSTMLLLPLCLLTAARPFAGEVLNYLLSLQNSLVRAISQVPHAAVGNTCIRWHEAVLLYAFIAFGMAYIGRHTARRLLLSLSMLAMFAASRVEFAMTHRPANALAIYSYNGAPVVHCMAADGHSWAVTDTASTVRPASLTHFCSTHGLKTPVVVSADYHNRQLTVRDQIVCYRGRKICMLTDNRWSGVSAGEPLRVDYVLVCRGFSGSLADALRLFSPHCVLLDSSLSSRRRERYSRICHEKKLRYRELSEKGCISILL